MKRVQKAAATLAALALTSAMVLPAGAVGNIYKVTADDNTATCPVRGTYELQTVYHVDVEWGSMEFTYTPGTWMGDASDSHSGNEKMQYVGENIGWSNGSKDDPSSYEGHGIKITNKSNANVEVGLKYESTHDACKDRVNGFFSNANGEYTRVWMERADKKVNGTAPGTEGEHYIDTTTNGTATETIVYLSLYGRPTKAIPTQTEIGHVTLTLSAGEENTPKTEEGLLIVE